MLQRVRPYLLARQQQELAYLDDDPNATATIKYEEYDVRTREELRAAAPQCVQPTCPDSIPRK